MLGNAWRVLLEPMAAVSAGADALRADQPRMSLGLHSGQIMRLIVLPQALRVITPLTTSSYLDLTDDSTLPSPSANRHG